MKRDEEVVCYKDVGCFQDEGPFDYFDMLPSSPDEIGTTFNLYTRQTQGRARLLHYKSLYTEDESTYNGSIPTKVIVHGFGSSCSHVWAQEMRLALLGQVKE